MSKKDLKIETSLYDGYTYINIRLLDIDDDRDEIDIEVDYAKQKHKETVDIFRDKYNRPYFEYENKRIYL